MSSGPLNPSRGDEAAHPPESQDSSGVTHEPHPPSYADSIPEFSLVHPTIARPMNHRQLETTSRVSDIVQADYQSPLPSAPATRAQISGAFQPPPIRRSGAFKAPSRSVTSPNGISGSSLRSEPLLQDQELIANRYQILRKIGQGGMGQVFSALDTRLQREVVVKVAHNQGDGPSPEDQARFNREAIKMASLNHPNIVTIYDYGVHDESQFLVMELIGGDTLKSQMTHGPMITRDEFSEIISQLLDGVQEAHDHDVIHRDLKPSNLMWDREKRRLKVLDFGLARGVEGDTVTQTGHVHGSIQYMAPEQIRGESQGPTTDIYAVGILCFQLLSHELPFRGDNTVELMFQKLQHDPHPLLEQEKTPTWVTPAIAELIERCLKLSPLDRPQSASACLEEFKACLGGGTQEVKRIADITSVADSPLSPPSEMSHLFQRFSTSRWIGLGAVGLLLVGYLIGALGSGVESEATVRFKPLGEEDLSLSELSINGEMRGNLPLEVTLPVGVHEVSLKYEGAVLARSYDLSAGQHTIWMRPPPPQPLELTLPQPGSILPTPSSADEPKDSSSQVAKISADGDERAKRASPVKEVAQGSPPQSAEAEPKQVTRPKKRSKTNSRKQSTKKRVRNKKPRRYRARAKARSSKPAKSSPNRSRNKPKQPTPSRITNKKSKSLNEVPLLE